MKKFGIIIAAVIIFGFAGWFAVTTAPTNKDVNKTVPSVADSQGPVQSTSDIFSYEGKAGEDALTLLKAKTTVEQNTSGLVISINGRKADDKKHEYWAFYVNGKMAEVGPKDYITKDGDKIEWKIEKY